MKSGEWRVESGEWRVKSGEWRVVSEYPKRAKSLLKSSEAATTATPNSKLTLHSAERVGTVKTVPYALVAKFIYSLNSKLKTPNSKLQTHNSKLLTSNF